MEINVEEKRERGRQKKKLIDRIENYKIIDCVDRAV